MILQLMVLLMLIKNYRSEVGHELHRFSRIKKIQKFEGH